MTRPRNALISVLVALVALVALLAVIPAAAAAGPVSLEAASSDVDYKSNMVVFRDIVITQGSIRVSAANPNSGSGYELEVIAMVVIGGTVLTGGRGTIVGTVLGILILRLMRNGIVLIGAPALAYNIFIGAIILAMMALHSWLDRRNQSGG